MKLALILNVIDPKIGGVMVMGDRGTGKSTTIRALADLLPEMKVVAKDPFNSDPEDPEGMSAEVRGTHALSPEGRSPSLTPSPRCATASRPERVSPWAT